MPAVFGVSGLIIFLSLQWLLAILVLWAIVWTLRTLADIRRLQREGLQAQREILARFEALDPRTA